MDFPYDLADVPEGVDVGQYLIDRNPGRIPIVINDNCFSDLCKRRFLVPNGMQVSKLINSIRRANSLRPEEALFLSAGNLILSATNVFGSVYEQHKNKMGLLALSLTREHAFG